jgi:tRNA A-37 threonylcarbamoyl transferase component Bud32/DNA-binding NarL/FixJ family response regulator
MNEPMDTPRTRKFLIVESDAKYAQWLQYSISAGWPGDAIVVMDWTSFGRVHTAMTARDYDIVMLALSFDEGIEEPTTDGFEWIRKLRSQPGFPEMIILAEGGSELAAVRTLRMGAADYLPKRLLNPARLQRSIKLTLRAIEKETQRRTGRAAQQAGGGAAAEPKPAAPATGQKSAAPARAESAPPMPAHISTHTGASLAQAAQIATMAAELAASRPPAAPAPLASVPAPQKPQLAHVSTHTGASLAKAASLALAAHPAREAPAPRADVVHEEPAARSQPGVPAPGAAPASEALSSSQPLPRETKPVAPESHQIPGYTILQRIGESEAAAVYLAISEDVGHNVALKISKRRYNGSSDDTGQRAIMFQREFEAIAALDHPSIIDLYDYGIHEGVEYLAMEYFPCGDLKARLQNPLTADEAIAFLTEIARSLKIVHEAGIIHRDLKPPNVMLRDDGSVVLIDFGLARSLLTGDSSTRTGVLRGSPYYMSPEQAQGEQLDARTDLYSLGVILYEMLAGRKPYLGASAIDVLQQHVMAPVPELPVHHLAYQPLLERLMSKSREQRIASCDDLLHALEQMRLSHDSGIIDPATLISASVAS